MSATTTKTVTKEDINVLLAEVGVKHAAILGWFEDLPTDCPLAVSPGRWGHLRRVLDERIRQNGTDDTPSTAEIEAERMGLTTADYLDIRDCLGVDHDGRTNARSTSVAEDRLKPTDAGSTPATGLSSERIAMTVLSLRNRLGPFPNELDAVRSLHQRQDVATPDDQSYAVCRTCYILDEGWPCTVARLIQVLDAQIAAEHERQRLVS